MSSNNSDLYTIIKRPLITEKSTALQEHNQYVFEVNTKANKIEIRKAIELIFPGRKVKSVRTMNYDGVTRKFGKKMGRTKAYKKAVVSLEGEPIELFTGV